MHPPILLLISPSLSSRSIIEEVLGTIDATLLTASSSEEAVRLIQQGHDIACVILDETRNVTLQDSAAAQITALRRSQIPTIVLGAEDSAKAAAETLRRGAADYLAAPVSARDLKAALVRLQALTAVGPASKDDALSACGSIISRSPQMKLLTHLAAEVAGTDATVLITGESGTGKELFARAIHAASRRSQGPFVALNCAGIPEHLLESELFGYHKGAFTDAKQSKPGRFQTAQGGTLFLDEIGEMSLTAQAKLLRVLEDHRISPLGETHDIAVDLRVIAATNEDLPAHIKAGKFRLDLYYRLNVYQLRIPPLRERLEDIEPIANALLECARRERGRRVQSISPEALALLRGHDWPGNVRELQNVIEGLTITCKEAVIRAEHLSPVLRPLTPSKSSPSTDGDPGKRSLLAFGLSFQEMERTLLLEALRHTRGNISEASRLLKVTRNTLRYRMAKYRLS
ncbi:MAG TPA: sigma-54 dependent transcriptional regulator [Nitrospira sp.]|nr:sigma-54 dependent transcriptional regulator [Nitrospira sp.]